MVATTSLTGEHAEDVLAQVQSWQLDGLDCALVFVIGTEGGAVRAPGALMAVGSGHSVGYISGGCIDADVELQARSACQDGQARKLRYGAGSPFVDLPLPCGGAIEVLILPAPDPAVVRDALAALTGRRDIQLSVTDTGRMQLVTPDDKPGVGDYVFAYFPKLRLRIAGRGADALALAAISEASGFATRLQLIDHDDIARAQATGLKTIERLQLPRAIPAADDDRWTAFILLFHDSDWEIPLLKQALEGDAFYIGAVGSRRTHMARCEALRAAGCTGEQVSAVHGPIGLVPSLRDASMLAVSALAEIIEHFPGKASSRRPVTAVLMLAAGASRRFESGDKLLADLDGRAVLNWAASKVSADAQTIKVAVVSPDTPQRADILRAHGWRVVDNPDAHLGQSTSVRAGIAAIAQDHTIDQVIVVLADMPFTPAAHLHVLREAADTPACTAVMSETDGLLGPPALFKREHFAALTRLEGDQGAKAVFLNLSEGAVTRPLAKEYAMDVDRVEDLAKLKERVLA